MNFYACYGMEYVCRMSLFQSMQIRQMHLQSLHDGPDATMLPCYTSRPAMFIDHKSETCPIDESTLENLCLAEQVNRITCPHYEMCFVDLVIFFWRLSKFC